MHRFRLLKYSCILFMYMRDMYIRERERERERKKERDYT
jgi:hypothetical protein